MRIFVVGLNHKSAPLEVREKLSLGETDLPIALSELQKLPTLSGVMATSTCNRFEVYGSTNEPDAALDAVRQWILARGNSQSLDVDDVLYALTDGKAVQHIFRVTSSLDSMVVGEAQILGQVKRAFSTASDTGSLDSTLNRCMTAAIRAAKRVRNDTAIGKNAVSVPQVSVELATKIFGDLRGRTALLIGAGEVSELAARSLVSGGVSRTIIANRSKERAQNLAQLFNGEWHLMDKLPELLVQADIVVSSTGAKDYILRAKEIKPALRKRRYRPMLFLDLAVPRDLDPKIARLSNVYLFDVDDLQEVVTDNLSERMREAHDGERIIQGEVERFVSAQRVDVVTPTIVRLRKQLTAIKDEELARALRGLGDLDKATQKRFNKLANSLVNRILHQPTVTMKEAARNGGGPEVAELVEALFGLNPAEPASGQSLSQKPNNSSTEKSESEPIAKA